MAGLSRLALIVLVPVAALALCIPVWAQPGPGGGSKPGGFGPGFGMFGAGPGFGMFGGGPGASLSAQYERLLNAPTVQKELNLSEEQSAKIKAAVEKTRTGMSEWFSGMRDWSEEERQAKMEEAGKKMQAQALQTRRAIEEALLPRQLERLRGIALQVMGVQALGDKEVQRDLKLESFQSAAIRVIGERSAKKTRELFGAGEDRDTLRTKMEEIRKSAEKQTMDVLSDEQKALLEKMKGGKLEIPDSELRGGRGPRGPGGRGPGGSGAPGKNRE